MGQASRAVMPAHVAIELARLRQPAARMADVPLWDYMTLEEYHMPRPDEEGLAVGTATKYLERLHQVGREVFGDSRFLIENGPTDEASAQILVWRDSAAKGGKARLEPHRKALRWWFAAGGIDDAALPEGFRKPWATRKSINRAKQAGTWRGRNLHFHLPTHMQRILASTPHEDELKSGQGWSRRDRRRAARYLDDTFHTASFLAFYAGSRTGEIASLKLSNYQPHRGGIIGWEQPKDEGGEPRDVIIPETFVWHSKVDPSLDHYLKYVRPRVDPNNQQEAFFLTAEGQPFTEKYIVKWFNKALRGALGKESPGAYGFRRGCATWRYKHGWTVKEIAELLHHGETLTEKHYLDWQWLRSPQGRAIRTREPRPATPIIRSNGTRHARNKSAGAQNAPAAQIPGENASGPVGVSGRHGQRTRQQGAPKRPVLNQQNTQESAAQPAADSPPFDTPPGAWA